MMRGKDPCLGSGEPDSIDVTPAEPGSPPKLGP